MRAAEQVPKKEGAEPSTDRFDAVMDGTPLDAARTAYYERMPASVKQKHLRCVQQGWEHHRLGEQDLLIGSACTGSDIGIICMSAFLLCVRSLLGLSVTGAGIDVPVVVDAWVTMPLTRLLAMLAFL